MAELQQCLYALVEHPPSAPSPIEVVVARGRRFARRRRMQRGAVGLGLVLVVSAAGLGVTQRSSERGEIQAAAGAGDAVSYPDEAGDGLGPGAEAAAFDIVRVGWAPSSDGGEQRSEGYSTSITVAGEARDDGAYVSYGEFPSDVPGETCQLYHFLTPGTTASANAFCGFAETRRMVGQVQGSEVTSTSTSDGGTVLIATFDDSALPRALAGARVLSRLSAFTCAQEPEGPFCGHVAFLDEARATSTLTYRV